MQGLSASVVWTVGLALVSDTVEKDQIGQALGYTTAAFSIGSLAGPLLGGVVYARGGYYAVFAMGFALILLDILLRLFMIEKSMAAQWIVPSSGVQGGSPTVEPKISSPLSSNGMDDEAKPTPPVAEPTSLELPFEQEKPMAKFILRLPPY